MRVECVVCHEMFDLPKGHKVHKCPKCRRDYKLAAGAAWREKHRRGETEARCSECGNVFLRTQDKIKTCGPKCQKERLRRLGNERRVIVRQTGHNLRAKNRESRDIAEAREAAGLPPLKEEVVLCLRCRKEVTRTRNNVRLCDTCRGEVEESWLGEAASHYWWPSENQFEDCGPVSVSG